MGDDIAQVADVCHEGGAITKVIIETALLTDEEKVVACRLAKEAEADFVKTSTGWASRRRDGRRRRPHARAVGPEMGVKASGGIRTAEDVRT